VRGEVRSGGKLVAESDGLFMRLPQGKVAEMERLFLEAESPESSAHPERVEG